MASSSSFSASASNYDVFINHRGPDVKKTLASHLYHRLLSCGVRVFLDAEEMQLGSNLTSQIEGAIATASVHIAIFSPRYAESPWVLEELVMMLESRVPILPVYYHVGPNELRRTGEGGQGVYARALRMLQRKKTRQEMSRYDSNTIKNWRNALSVVSDICGFDLQAFNDDEGELLEKIVESVLKLVRRAPPLHEARVHPTGLDAKAEDFENTVLSQHQTGKPHVVGIVGLAGIGKTSLAKEIFNRKRSFFSRSFFLSNIREKARTCSLHFLQRLLCEGLINVNIGSGPESIKLFKENASCIYGSSALVVLDDIDGVDQLDALLPSQNHPNSKSLILITSRHEDVIIRSRVEEPLLYNLTGLNLIHSRELFYSKAFGQSHPSGGFEDQDLIDHILEPCDGIPLYLKVYGSLVCPEKGTSYWRDQLKCLLDLDLYQRLPDWDLEQLERLPRDIENLKKLSRKEGRDILKIDLLQRQSGEVNVVGIFGLDGIGKTTLAKELFESNKLSYGTSCFLYDVRASYLQSLFSKLLKDLTPLDRQVESAEECIALFKEAKQVFPSLVVLDNVDHWDQLHALLSVLQNVLPSSSLILIASRDKHVLNRAGVQESSIYKLKRLDWQVSRELFCSRAFGQPSPLPEFKGIVDEFVRACNRMPLLLKVFGALLGAKTDRSYWQDQLDRLQRTRDIQEKLKISFDTLNREEKQIFSYIACCCIGEKSDLARRLLNGLGPAGLSGFESLQKRCLVEVDSEDCIIMYKYLRDLGRTIADERGLRPPLWPPTENNPSLLQQSSNEQIITELRRNIDDLLQQSSVIREVRGFLKMIFVMMIIVTMMMAMMNWSKGLTIILITMITAMLIWMG